MAIKQTDLNILTTSLTGDESNEKYNELVTNFYEIIDYGVSERDARNFVKELDKKIDDKKSYNKMEDQYLELLGDHSFEFIIKDRSGTSRIIKKVNFTEVTENEDISQASGVILYKFFGTWSK